LKALKIPFRVISSHVCEKSPQKDPRRLAVELARRKAMCVARKFPLALVLGADTIVYRGRKMFFKPRSLKDSERILKSLNGRWHRVVTGIALAQQGGRIVLSASVVSRVKARRLKPAELSALAGKHMDKSGAYAIQDRKDPFIQTVIGELDNVVGLPLKAVRRALKTLSRLPAPH
jgi:septum formation protein